MDQTDINKISETVLIPLFAIVYGYENLENLNYTEKRNYPGIDLADRTARIAIQVTSTTNSTKIKETLQQFVKHKLYKSFDRLMIYILTEKQKSYSGSGYNEIIQGRFTFDKDEDILDYQELLRHVANLQLDQAQRVERLLEQNFGEKRVLVFGEKYEPSVESVLLNLLSASLPSVVYIADLSIDRDEVIANSAHFKIRLTKRSPTRNIVRAALEQSGLIGREVPFDWVPHANQVVTFRDFSEPTNSLIRVIDEGTITPLSSEEFYEIDENYENVFKTLLWRCLQEKLFYQVVKWQTKEELFIFSETEGAVRKEKWSGSPEGRIVFKRTMKTNKPDEILECKHFAFEGHFKRFAEQWFLQIRPDWFFSYDGYNKHFTHADKMDWLKRQEANQHVYNHIRFLAEFLKDEGQASLFETRHRYPYLSFGELRVFSNSPILDDKSWLNRESAEKRRELTSDEQMVLL